MALVPFCLRRSNTSLPRPYGSSFLGTPNTETTSVYRPVSYFVFPTKISEVLLVLGLLDKPQEYGMSNLKSFWYRFGDLVSDCILCLTLTVICPTPFMKRQARTALNWPLCPWFKTSNRRSIIKYKSTVSWETLHGLSQGLLHQSMDTALPLDSLYSLFVFFPCHTMGIIILPQQPSSCHGTTPPANTYPALLVMWSLYLISPAKAFKPWQGLVKDIRSPWSVDSALLTINKLSSLSSALACASHCWNGP